MFEKISKQLIFAIVALAFLATNASAQTLPLTTPTIIYLPALRLAAIGAQALPLKSLGTAPQFFAYASYDNAGNRKALQMTRGLTALSTTYNYNAIYELTSVAGAQTHAFAYDNVNNRKTADGVTYAVNNLHQYTTVGAQSYQYDLNGNLKNNGSNAYTYDEANRLATMTNTASTASYEYDGFNRRTSKTVNGVKTYLISDWDNEIEERTVAGVLSADYVYGDNIDEVLTMTRGGSTYYYHYDGLGSVTDLTDAAGSSVESYDYDVYGQPTTRNSAGTIIPTSGVGNPFLFTGRRLDTESSIYTYRARMYDPTIGRFLQRDPVGYYDAMNLQQYVRNNPTNWIDPYGEQAAVICALVQQVQTRGPAWWALLVARATAAAARAKALADATEKGLKDWIKKSKESDKGQTADDKLGVPTEKDGYVSPKKWDGKKVKNPNGNGSGYSDKKGRVWVPTDHKGTHGPHWDVQDPKTGNHDPVYPK